MDLPHFQNKRLISPNLPDFQNTRSIDAVALKNTIVWNANPVEERGSTDPKQSSGDWKPRLLGHRVDQLIPFSPSDDLETRSVSSEPGSIRDRRFHGGSREGGVASAEMIARNSQYRQTTHERARRVRV